MQNIDTVELAKVLAREIKNQKNDKAK